MHRGLTLRRLLTIKGAPDVILNRCSSYITDAGVPAPLTPETKAAFEAAKNKYSSQGKRCILLARKVISKFSAPGAPNSTEYEKAIVDQATSGLVLVGLVAIVDPLRHDIVEVVSTLRGAGVRIAMVTGDFALTALAIARDAGIVTSATVDSANALARFPTSIDSGKHGAVSQDDAQSSSSRSGSSSIVISGPELMSLNEQQWASLISYDEIVFARTTPEQKLRIVREYQAKGNVVAMTGDGVNDAPSLKAADVGISMGSGSDIAMEAADMVLLDSFSAIVIAVEYGRVVFDNLKKVSPGTTLLHQIQLVIRKQRTKNGNLTFLIIQVISYLLPAGSFAEFWPVMASVCFGLPQILSSFLMIIIW
jgi:sodium/potassium-transporting ATPase subunit alpha